MALAHLADVQRRRLKTAEAAEALDRAEAAAGTTAFTARIRGDLHFGEKRWRDAAAAYREASVLGEPGIWSLVRLARCHLRLGEPDAARGAAAQVAERDEGPRALAGPRRAGPAGGPGRRRVPLRAGLGPTKPGRRARLTSRTACRYFEEITGR